MEFKVGKGSLLISMTDMEKCVKYPEGMAFHQSLIRYFLSDAFHPQVQISLQDLMAKLKEDVKENQLDELNNISPY